MSLCSTAATTTTKPFVPSIWGRLHEPKENYAGSGTILEVYCDEDEKPQGRFLQSDCTSRIATLFACISGRVEHKSGESPYYYS